MDSKAVRLTLVAVACGALFASGAVARPRLRHHHAQQEGFPIIAGSNSVRINRVGQVLAPDLGIQQGVDGSVKVTPPPPAAQRGKTQAPGSPLGGTSPVPAVQP